MGRKRRNQKKMEMEQMVFVSVEKEATGTTIILFFVFTNFALRVVGGSRKRWERKR